MDCIEQGQRFIDPLINEKYMDVVKKYRENGLTISGYGVLKFNTDAELSRKWFEFAQAIGISSIVADFSLGEELETAALLEPLCEEFDVDIAIHNHGRRHHLGAPYALDRVFAQTSTNIGLCLDTAWMLDSGCDPVDIAQKYSDRLYGVHVKDFIFDRAGKSEDTIVEQGNLRLDDLVKGYGGHLTLEYELGYQGSAAGEQALCRRDESGVEQAIDQWAVQAGVGSDAIRCAPFKFPERICR